MRPELQSIKTTYAVRHATEPVLRQISPGTGTISSVYSHSFSVTCAPANDYLFNFTAIINRMHPLSILIDPEIIAQVSIHDPVIFRLAPRVGAGPCPAAGFPNIEINGLILKCNEIIPEIIPPKPAGSEYRNHPAAINQVLQSSGKLSPVLSELGGVLDKIRKDLKRGHIATRLGHGLNCLDYLPYFGAGDGLTPAFDDFFTGLLLADRWAGNNFITSDSDFFSALKNKTTLPSWWQLQFAGQGKSSLVVEQFLREVLTGNSYKRSLLDCLAIGHTSGATILYGIITYLLVR